MPDKRGWTLPAIIGLTSLGSWLGYRYEHQQTKPQYSKKTNSRVITIGIETWTGHLPLYVAQEDGSMRRRFAKEKSADNS